MTGAFKKLISAWQNSSAIYRAKIAETERVFDAEGSSPTVMALEAETTPCFGKLMTLNARYWPTPSPVRMTFAPRLDG